MDLILESVLLLSAIYTHIHAQLMTYWNAMNYQSFVVFSAPVVSASVFVV
ncbi:hypothetical protein [Acinetobacter baumannii]|nr:hypothetical protein [Acinetobacter baumannii]